MGNAAAEGAEVGGGQLVEELECLYLLLRCEAIYTFDLSTCYDLQPAIAFLNVMDFASLKGLPKKVVLS